MDPNIVHRDGEGFVARVELDLYGLEPLLKAAHRMTGRCFVHLEHEDATHILCRFRAKEPGDDVELLAHEFLNNALDEVLRARIAATSEPVRRLLIAQAFSKVNLLHAENEETETKAEATQGPEAGDAAK